MMIGGQHPTPYKFMTLKNILNTLLESQLEGFAREYVGTSREVFYDDLSGTLIHPGEFGGLREALVRELLTNFLPEAYGVSQGFVISPDGQISNQCDVVIYARQYTPVVRTAAQQRFFPVESVVAVGEVKSIIDATILKDALQKLTRIKEMRVGLEHPAVAWNNSAPRDYMPFLRLQDQLGTFIVGESISCQMRKVVETIKEVRSGKHPSLGVNLIVTVQDYCLAYHDTKNKLWMYPVDVDDQNRIISESLPLEFVIPQQSSIQHLKLFLRYMDIIVNRTTILYPELTQYYFRMGSTEGMGHIQEGEL